MVVDPVELASGREPTAGGGSPLSWRQWIGRGTAQDERPLPAVLTVLRDAGPVLTVFLIGASAVAGSTAHPVWLSWLVVCLPLVPAAARHHRPVPAFITTFLCAAAGFASLGGSGTVLVAGVGGVLLCVIPVVTHAADRYAAGAVVASGLLIAALAITPGSGQQVVTLIAAAVAAVALGRNRRARHAVLIGMRERAVTAERTQLALAYAAVAEERRRIAREVHDIVSHNIAVMTNLADGADVALRSTAGVPAAQQAVQAIAGAGREAMQEMHALLGVLRDPDDDSTGTTRPPAPGLGQLDSLVDQVRAAGLPVTFEVSGAPVPVGGGTALTAYRVVQEALSNTMRHAPSATRAIVALQWTAQWLTVTVRDDGGPPGDAGSGPGLGLVGMRERVQAHGGQLHRGPIPGGGWLVEAVLPVGAAHPEVAR